MMFFLSFLMIFLLITPLYGINPKPYPILGSNVQGSEAIKMLEKFSFKPDAVILALGCHTGSLAYELAKKVPQGKVICIDANIQIIETAQKRYQQPNLQYIALAPTDLPYQNTFDTVISIAFLHWQKNKATIFNNIYQSLKPGGSFIARIGISDTLGRYYPLHCHIHAVANQEPWNTYTKELKNSWYFGIDSIADFAKLVETSGLQPISLEFKRRTSTFTEKKLADWLKTWIPHLSYIPEKEHDSFVHTIAHAYAITAPQTDDGQIILERPSLEIVIEKLLS